MSYSLDEAILDSEDYAVFLKAVKEAYPDAIKNGHQWLSRSLTLEDCDGFEIQTETSKGLDYPFHYARFYRTLAGGRVYFQDYNRTLLDTVFLKIKEKDPDFYTLLLKKIQAY